MAKKAEKSLVVGLDIGTSKVVAIVGEIGLMALGLILILFSVLVERKRLSSRRG